MQFKLQAELVTFFFFIGWHFKWQECLTSCYYANSGIWYTFSFNKVNLPIHIKTEHFFARDKIQAFQVKIRILENLHSYAGYLSNT